MLEHLRGAVAHFNPGLRLRHRRSGQRRRIALCSVHGGPGEARARWQDPYLAPDRHRERERKRDRHPPLRDKTGFVTLDPAFVNTASTTSAITFLDGRRASCATAASPSSSWPRSRPSSRRRYLLIYGNLPNEAELKTFYTLLTRHSLIHEDMKRFFDGFPATRAPDGHPRGDGVLAVELLPRSARRRRTRPSVDITIARLLAKVRTIAAFAYKKSIGQPFVYPQNRLATAPTS